MQKILAACLLLCAGCSFRSAKEQPPVFNTPTSAYTCYQAVDEIVVDGKLTEQSWRLARPVELTLYNGEPSPVKTTAKMVWNGDAIYIAAECEDKDIFTTLTRRDEHLYKQDVFEVFVLNQKTNAGHYLEYEFSPNATIFDLYLTAPFKGEDFTSDKLAVAADIAGTPNDPETEDTGWTVEIAIPLEDFAGNRIPSELKMNLYRIDYSTPSAEDGTMPETGEQPAFLTWSPTGAINFHMPDRFGTVTLSTNPVGEEK